MFQQKLGCIKYSIQLYDKGPKITVSPYLDGHVKNKEKAMGVFLFWELKAQTRDGNYAYLHAKTYKSNR
ncbi:MAG: hypothetical protein CM15mP32_5930 [Flavobacteriaceae bacterium]|nr:MAG: hypothetical protein CM15mP32_5930 [Flavobacteriaceae bacterium]